jgi:mono/diheme cytochrome c family protein
MNTVLPLTQKLRTGAVLAMLAGIWITASPHLARAADSTPGDKAKTAKKTSKKTKKELTGAELYAIHCNRCHPERYAPERTDVQWKTILTHMRVRANLPARQAEAILKFLQEDSGK